MKAIAEVTGIGKLLLPPPISIQHLDTGRLLIQLRCDCKGEGRATEELGVRICEAR